MSWRSWPIDPKSRTLHRLPSILFYSTKTRLLRRCFGTLALSRYRLFTASALSPVFSPRSSRDSRSFRFALRQFLPFLLVASACCVFALNEYGKKLMARQISPRSSNSYNSILLLLLTRKTRTFFNASIIAVIFIGEPRY